MAPRERIAIWPSDRASRMTTKAKETLAANRTLTLEEVERYQAFAFDPGGAARTLTLPAEAECEGAYLWVSNEADAAEPITVNNDTPAAIDVVAQNECVFLWCDGTSWYSQLSALPKTTAKAINVKAAETLAANRAITAAELALYNAFAFDPAGARDVTLPAEATSAGALIMIANTADAAEVITIKNDGGGTICTPTQAEAALLWCDGTNWYGLVGAMS